MKYLISGASGLIGQALSEFLRQQGHQVQALRRSRQAGLPTDVYWEPQAATMDSAALEGFDGIIHLAGESIASGRWSAAKKNRIRNSRVQGTSLLAQAVAKLQHKPEVFICASAVGFYGDRGAEILTEESLAGGGFLAEVCQAWEQATAAASHAGVRVVQARLGVVLTPRGGALAPMLLPFRLGLGAVMGTGQQYMSWVSLADVVQSLAFILQAPQLQGAVNIVAPEPVTQQNFSQILAQVLHRPLWLRLPAWSLRLLLGEVAEALLLSSSRVLPAKLKRHGYAFVDTALKSSLTAWLQR